MAVCAGVRRVAVCLPVVPVPGVHGGAVGEETAGRGGSQTVTGGYWPSAVWGRPQ